MPSATCGTTTASSTTCSACWATTRSTGWATNTLRYSLSPTSLGDLLVAESDHGVAGLALGEAGDLLSEFRVAEVSPVRPEIVRAVEDPGSPSAVALDLRGTPFQKAVWERLRQIPPGSTTTYSELARQLGTSARAVGSACAANPVAVLVPCHRVVAADGSLTGYRWGLDKKRELLRREAETC